MAQAINNRKVAIIGAGYVGASIAYAMSLRGLANEIVLIDVNSQKAYGEALDIRHGIPFMGSSYVYAGDFSDCKDCSLIIITAGRNRKPGETRLNLANDNSIIVKKVINKLYSYYNKGAILIISNPVDILVKLCDKQMGLPSGKVFGTGCILDTSRFIVSLSDFLQIDNDVISASIVGEHGASQFPLWSRVSVAGFFIDEYCNSTQINWGELQKNKIMTNVRDMGSKIIEVKERTHYGIATCVCYIADCIINNRATIASVSSVFNGEYGINGVALSVPSIITVDGVTRRLEENWKNDEVENLNRAADILKETLNKVL